MADCGRGEYNEHDDRVGGGGRPFPPRRRKGRGSFRGRLYSEMNHPRNWSNPGPSPRRPLEEEEDGDVLMNEPQDALRPRYSPYGSRPNRDRGGMRPGMRRNPNSEEGYKVWYRITIPGGRKYDQSWLIRSIQETCSTPVNPLEIHHINNRLVFYVADAQTANALRQISRKVVGPDGYKMPILTNQCSVSKPAHRELSLEEIEHLKKCMSKRYDGSLQALDLKKLNADPDLLEQNIEMFLNRSNCMKTVMQIIGENIPELLSLDLSTNRLFRLDDLAELPLKAPKLKSLNLSSNWLKSERDLNKLKGLKLDELWLDGNQLCDSFRDQSTYIRAVRERFPKLLRLDGHELPPPISFDVETPTKLPPCKGSYFGSEDLKGLILQFLQEYYAIYDSTDRQGLLDAYHDGACCSLTIPCSLVNPSRTRSLSEYYKSSRNVKKLKDPCMRFRLLKHTRLNAVAFLSELPRTQHDTNSFVVDVCVQTNSLLCFTLFGVFKEVDGRWRDAVRAFSRVFIAVPAGINRLSIVNDQLFIRKASNEEIRKAFVMPAPTPSSSPVPTLSAEQQEMLQNFSLQSGMNIEWSQKCLLDNDWDYNQAAHAFTQLKAKGKIPEVAFMN
ncbi:nuclear RNA export factor 1 [Hemicordylus capensis]|uniref:nuclear RNA export factor 1 n=1 Tax=Hemicordylus capensis TaxID=884348 RepID=UPI00230419A3|nr:nuclear RNA export factor 1 [Hemicordylus capensis]